MENNIRSLVNGLDNKSAGLNWAETMLYFLLAAISILFIFLAGSFWQTIPLKAFTVPPALSLSTVCITVSCLLTIKIKQFKNHDRLRPYRIAATLAVLAGGLFFVCQFYGWMALVNQFASGTRNLVLVLLVAHAVHFIVAFVLCVYFAIQSYSTGSSADLYIWFLNPKRQVFFRLTFLYWDFLGYLWVLLFVLIQVRVMM